MVHSTEIDKVAGALVALGAEIKNPHNTAENPFHKNKYAPLNDMLNDLRPLLHKHGLTVMQGIIGEDGEIGVETIIMHESGQYIGTDAAMPIAQEKGKSPAQVAGSTISYLRRYAVAAALNVASEDDDDGNTGLNRPEPPRQANPTAIPAELSAEFKDVLAGMTPDTAQHYRERGSRLYKAGNVEGFRDLIAEARNLESELYKDKEPKGAE